MKKAFLILITILTFTSCKKSNETSKIVGADWLLGKWKNNSKDGNLSETWGKVNDSLYNGESYFIKGKDTLHAERIQLKQKGETLFYISTIKGQNNDKPVTYKHNSEIENQLIFENPNNEYPQKIGYSQITKDRIVIAITGIQQKKTSTEKYEMKKTN